ncbi:MAG: hypothetical protein H6745_28520 [Deltaproteobacteria bacterium]|nr:hypothetical protein [Deltaproteobacteria bacterium]
MVRKLILTAVSAAVLGGGSALAAAPGGAGVDRAVDTLLSGYELVPTDADWAKAGPPEAVAARLMAVADDEGAGIARSRAMSSLGHFPTPAVTAFLRARATDPAQPAGIRGKAAIAWAVAAKEAAAPELARLLGDPDEKLREDAARALRHCAAPEVATFLRARAALEPVPWVKEALKGAATAVDTRRERLVVEKKAVPSVAMPTDVPRVKVAPR